MVTSLGVIDTETTGMDPEEDRLVEIAVVRSGGAWDHTLVNPGDRAISFGAMATHHITPDMVADAPDALEALGAIGLGPDDAPDVLVFHNAEYDRQFLPLWLRERPHICTYRCALHLVPNAESHSNGALWYELGLNGPMPEEAGQMPHRALFDALMTADIVEWMLNKVLNDHTMSILENADRAVPSFNELDHLIELTSLPVRLTKCRFGKHRGERWEDIDSGYMEWCLGQDFDEDVRHTCEEILIERGRRQRRSS